MNQLTCHPIKYPPIKPPPLKLQLREIFSGIYLSNLLNWKSIPIPTDINQKTIMIIPGFGGGDLSVLPLKKFLRRQGHHAYSWGLGLNNSQVERFIGPLLRRIKFLNDKHGKAISLVGWSLGGIIARELARYKPKRIASVVTMGSPVIGGPKVTALRNLSGLFGWDMDKIEREMIERYTIPINRPITAIYSKKDGIVSWQACIDHWSPSVQHHEVSTSHIGMGFSEEVYRIISHTLSQ